MEGEAAAGEEATRAQQGDGTRFRPYLSFSLALPFYLCLFIVSFSFSPRLFFFFLPCLLGAFARRE